MGLTLSNIIKSSIYRQSQWEEPRPSLHPQLKKKTKECNQSGYTLIQLKLILIFI